MTGREKGGWHGERREGGREREGRVAGERREGGREGSKIGKEK